MIEERAARAVARACARLERTAAEEMPGDVAVERIEGGVALSGRGLARRRIEDARIRGFALGMWR